MIAVTTRVLTQRVRVTVLALGERTVLAMRETAVCGSRIFSAVESTASAHFTLCLECPRQNYAQVGSSFNSGSFIAW
jgi:hypothetical protein